MAWWDRWRTRTKEPQEGQQELLRSPAPESTVASPPTGGETRWYAPPDGNPNRFRGVDGKPSVHLIDYGQGDGQVLRFCEDSTGLLVGPTDRRLALAGLLVSNLRGGRYYLADGRAGDFRPGADVMLVPEPDNPHDSRAVAVFDTTGQHRAGYVSKQKARAYLKRAAAGERLAAVSLRGSRPGIANDVVSILIATPAVIAHVSGPRSAAWPVPAHLRNR